MGATELPGAPEVVCKILALVDREGSSSGELGAVIARDPALAARVLQFANSALFGLRTRPTSVPHAVTLLGFARVKQIALAVSVLNAFDTPTPEGRRFRRELLTHCVAVAAAAKTLAERVGSDAGEAYTAGLLHDVGKLVLLSHVGEPYRILLEQAALTGQSLSAREDDVFGCTHATVGGWLLQLWRLPAALVAPVAAHHAPLAPGATLDTPTLVAVADILANGADQEGGISPSALATVSATAPALVDEESWKGLYATISAEREAMSGLFAG
jgi:putative nucleotidyltransferase with HDIG domain